MDQNVAFGCKYLRAKQNAERLHGSARKGIRDEQSAGPLADPIQMVKVSLMEKGREIVLRAPKKSKQKNTTKQVVLRSRNVVAAPAAMGEINRGRRSNYPSMVMRGPQAIVRNYEQVASFPTGNTAFQDAGAISNVGIAASFPWLSSIAVNYSKFRFRYLRFFFSGSCPTSTTGKVWITLQYDALDSAPATLAQVLQSEDSCSGPAWFGGVVSTEKAFDRRLAADSNIYVDADIARFAQPWYYVRSSATDVGVSLSGAPTGGIGSLVLAGNTLDTSAIPCRVFYGNNGVTSSTVPGELYVAYEVELIEPIYSGDNN